MERHRPRRPDLAVAAASAALLVGGVVGLLRERPGSPAPAGEEATAGGGTDQLTIANFAYGPEELTVPVGTTLTWTNQDEFVHTVTADEDSFDSGRLEQGATFEFTFDTAGEFAYVCTIHANMNATVTVEEA